MADENGETKPESSGRAPDDSLDRRAKAIFGHSGRDLPDRVGPYKILERLGEGGMGAVFLAEQSEPVRRRVALKVIKLGMDTREIVGRFEAERQALALMNHPNVARVFDAGATESGRPYFAMEHVPGVSITEYCDREQLTTRQRLGLFQQVCHAVQHAHQKGIIHRDIKPSNILVSVQDGRPIPKVIDFGVAKAINQRLTEKTVYTGLGQLVGTPEYMSPEQAEMTALDIDTRTDIYSLGVLLYELLVGTRPFESKVLREADYAAVQRIIRESEPPKPSTMLSSLGEASSKISACRGSDPTSLARQIRGDLDWIVMKCLEKNRTRRYDTANVLAMEIERHLNNEPVLAGPPSTTYRLHKFVRRNRGAVLAGSVVTVALIAATSISITFGVRESRARAGEETQRKLAEDESENARLAETEQRRLAEAEAAARAKEERERRKAEAINKFVTNALVSSDPHKGGAQGFLVTDAMEQAIELLDAGELKDQPETEAGLRLTIAEILDGNARSEEALRLARRALGLNQGLHPGDHLDVATSLNSVAAFLRSLGRSAEALPKYEAALEMCRRLFEGDHPDVAMSLNNVASCLKSLGRPAEALPKHEAALAMRQRLFPGDHPDVATSLNNVGTCLRALGRSAEALPKYEAALEMYQRLYEGDHPYVATCLNNVAACLGPLDRSAEALPKFEAALEMRLRLFQGDHPAVATGLNNVGNCLDTLGRLAEALPKLEAALGMRQRLFKGDHPNVATSLNNVGTCLRALGRSAEALAKYEAALEMFQRLFDGSHPIVARAMNNVAVCLNSLGRSAEALTKYEAALEMNRRILPQGHPRTLYPQIGLARTLVTLGRHAEAELLLRDAAEQCEQSAASRRQHWLPVLVESVRLYDAWDADEPDQGYDAKATEWGAKLQAWRASTQAATTQAAP